MLCLFLLPPPVSYFYAPFPHPSYQLSSCADVDTLSQFTSHSLPFVFLWALQAEWESASDPCVYPPPCALSDFLWQHQLNRMCETDEEICALLPSFGSFHLHLKSSCPDLNFSHPEFNCRILNLLISLCILSLSILLPLSTSFSFL